MKTSTAKKYVLLFVLLVIGIFGMRSALQLLIAKHDASTLAVIDHEIAVQRALLVSLADVTRQNSSDASTESFVIDCKAADRQRFDSLLDSLSKTISARELTELDVLFYKCGNFYALRKAILAARLDREVATYVSLSDMRSHVQPFATDVTTETDAWRKIAAAERQWSGYFNDLVTHQGSIISLLQAGKTAAAPEVVAILAQVSEARAQMEVLGSQIQGYRQTLSSI